MKYFGIMIIVTCLVLSSCNGYDSNDDESSLLENEIETLESQLETTKVEYDELLEKYTNLELESNDLTQQKDDEISQLKQEVEQLKSESENNVTSNSIRELNNGFLTREFTYKSEGDSYVEEFYLLDDETFPIAVYIPSNERWSVSLNDGGFTIYVSDWLTLEFGFYSDVQTENDIVNGFNEMIGSDYEEATNQEYDWVIKRYDDISFEDNKYNAMFLGLIENHFFYIKRTLKADYVEGYYPYERIILNNILLRKSS